MAGSSPHGSQVTATAGGNAARACERSDGRDGASGVDGHGEAIWRAHEMEGTVWRVTAP